MSKLGWTDRGDRGTNRKNKKGRTHWGRTIYGLESNRELTTNTKKKKVYLQISGIKLYNYQKQIYIYIYIIFKLINCDYYLN